jgi:hypothetical protein|tara:strand:- start:178 stop:423 length:246 start_codon:yes stop_codon:yes gene_type:complete
MSKKTNSISKKQLLLIKEQQLKNSQLNEKIGVISRQYHAVLHEAKELDKVIDETKNELESEYGAVNINLIDGTYTFIEQDV